MDKPIKWKLRACTAQAGFTQSEVAKFLGCSEKSIVDYENGISTPLMEKGQRLAELYGIPISMMDFAKEGNKTLTKEERAVLLARMLPEDEVVDVSEV